MLATQHAYEEGNTWRTYGWRRRMAMLGWVICNHYAKSESKHTHTHKTKNCVYENMILKVWEVKQLHKQRTLLINEHIISAALLVFKTGSTSLCSCNTSFLSVCFWRSSLQREVTVQQREKPTTHKNNVDVVITQSCGWRSRPAELQLQ